MEASRCFRERWCVGVMQASSEEGEDGATFQAFEVRPLHIHNHVIHTHFITLTSYILSYTRTTAS